LKVLIVDDEYEKVGQIVELVNSVCGDASVEHVTTALDARKRLRKSQYDLMIVDLNLPASIGDAPTEQAGAELVEIMLHDDLCRIPFAVEFITAKECDFESASTRVAGLGARLNRYGAADADWRICIKGRIRSLAKAKRRNLPRVDVALVTAMRATELEAVLKLPFNWIRYSAPSDNAAYYLGEYRVGGAIFRVVAAAAMRKGMASSAALAARMIAKFRPSLLVMPGICAGMEGKTSFGDVVVADPSWDWGSGKRTVTLDGPAFLLSPHQSSLHPSLSNTAQQLAENRNLLAGISSRWDGPLPAGRLRAHIGPLASGASVLADGETIAEIRRLQNRDLLAVDMEAYAVMDAASYSSDSEEVRAIAIKSVCDFAGGDKGDEWQTYAAYTSAEFVSALLMNEATTSYLEFRRTS
jgi:nucleoside phosphorylase/CheY-like chemotaxis protein